MSTRTGILARIEKLASYSFLGFLFLNCISVSFPSAFHHPFTIGLIASIIVLFGLQIPTILKENFKHKNVLIGIVVLWGVALISTIASPIAQVAWPNFARVSIFIFLMVMLLLLRNSDQLYQKILFTFIAVGLVSALSIYVDVFRLGFFTETGLKRFDGIYRHPNIASYILAVNMAIAFFLGWYKKRNTYLYMAFIMLPALFLTYSRSSYIFVAVSIPILFFSLRSIPKKWLFVGAGVVTIALVVAWPFVSQVLRLENILSYRDYIWEAALNLSADYRWFGVGPGGMVYFLKDYLPANKIPTELLNEMKAAATHAHNMYLQVLGEYGVVGFLIIISFVVYVIRLSVREMKQNKYALLFFALIVGLLARNLFETNGFVLRGWFAIDVYIWLMLIVAIKKGELKNG